MTGRVGEAIQPELGRETPQLVPRVRGEGRRALARPIDFTVIAAFMNGPRHVLIFYYLSIATNT